MALPSPFVTMQTAAMLTATATIGLSPPDRGAILIWSPAGEATDQIASWALDGTNRLIARGPLTGSLVIWGEGSRVSRLARSHGAVALRAPSSMCGDFV